VKRGLQLFALYKKNCLLSTILFVLGLQSQDLIAQFRFPPEISRMSFPAFPQTELVINRLDHQVNYIRAAHFYFPDLRGEGIRISVKEYLFDTSDIDLAYAYRFSPHQLPVIQTHSTIMATMIAGRGNSSPSSVGVAPAAGLYSSSFVPALPDTDNYYRANAISVQNHSYGEDINNVYGPEAAAFDQNAWQNPFLLHIFSSGNRGNAASPSGRYSNLEGFANLTGNFKMSKNSIAVGAIDTADRIETLSSRGPAYDGRLKPELTAFGIEGTSGSAALTSGLAALLQQAYKKYHDDSLPPSSLIKAALINSALDLGTPGPDFTYGYGKINALQALKTMTGQKYIIGLLKKDQTARHAISIPADVKNLKITLAWLEKPAEPFAPFALRNDLDLRVEEPSTALAHLPYVPNTFPHPDSLTLPASPGEDHLNTVEQVMIADPGPGTYTIVLGGGMMDSSQAYSLCYEWEERNRLTWTHPLNIDFLEAGRSQELRWLSTYDPKVEGSLAFSFDSLTWMPILTGLSLSEGKTNWLVPDTNAVVYFRLTADGAEYFTRSVILKKLEMEVGYICEDSVLVSWNKLEGVDSFGIYRMDQGLMRTSGHTPDTFWIFKADPGSPYIAVSTLIAGHETRLPVLNYTDQGVACFIRQFIGRKIDESNAELTLALGTVFGIKNIRIDRINHRDSLTVLNANLPTQANFTVEAGLKEGSNLFRLRLTLQNQRTVTDEARLYSLGSRIGSVFPNPVRGGQSLNLKNYKTDPVSVTLFDLNGRPLFNTLLRGEGSLDLPGLSPGIYFIGFYENEKLRFREKVVIY